MSNVPNSGAVTKEYGDTSQSAVDLWQGLTLEPTHDEIEVLSSFERFAFRLVRRMNRGSWKRFWTFCQRTFGAGWIYLSTYNIMNVYGLENVDAVSHELPILLVANHRS